MARFRRLYTLQQTKEQGLIPLFHETDFDVARDIVEALADGGAKVIEFTNRGDSASEIFSQLENWCRQKRPDVILGVGSIVDSATAAIFIGAGANFVVGPLLDADTARLCNARKIPYIPGCATASEIHQAHLLGVEICKLFPAEATHGPGFVKSLLGPCPWTDIMPTGGISPTRESLSTWFAAGIACAGMGTQLVSKELVRSRHFAAITAKLREALDIIREIRASGSQ